MLAAHTPRFGPASVLEVRDVATPAVGPNEVCVEVHASPVTAGDLRLRAADFPGISKLVGLLMFGFTAPRRPVQGTMYAGTVVAVGAQVTAFSLGDSVFGCADDGAWAEQLVVAADGAIAHRPLGVDASTAAAVPYGAGTALYFLRTLADVQRGERVLILGGSGGVGRFAIQVAKRLGAHVTAVGSAASLQLMRRLGADVVIDYRTTEVANLGQTWDVVFDIADCSSFAQARALMTPSGRYLTLIVSLRVLLEMGWSHVVGGQRALFGVALPEQDAMNELASWLSEGALVAQIAQQLPLLDIANAHRAAERRVLGEVIVMPTAQPAAGRSPE